MSRQEADDSNITISPSESYPPLEPPPDFKSQIPEHLMVDTTPADRFLMEQISIMRQHMDWSVKAHLSQDRQLRYTNGKVRRHETDIAILKDDKRSFLRGWRALLAVSGFFAGIVSFLALVYQTFWSKGVD